MENLNESLTIQAENQAAQKAVVGDAVSVEKLVKLAGEHSRITERRTDYYSETVYYIPHHEDADGNIHPYLDDEGKVIADWRPFVLAGQPVSPSQKKLADKYLRLFAKQNDLIRKEMERKFLKANRLAELPYPGCPWRVKQIVPLKEEPILEN